MIYLNGRKNNYDKINIIIFIIFSLIIFLSKNTNCLIEIPVEIIYKKNNINKYNNNINNNKQISKYNPILFIEEGVTKINSQHLFIVNIKIGSNSQIFRLILDTGSSLTWVADIDSQIDGTTQISNRFDPNLSSSCVKLYKSFNIKYGTGSCSGYYYIDIIKYINNKEFKLKFGVVKNAQFDFSEADGILGLSRTTNDITTSFISMLYESKIIDSKLFSFKFASNNLELPMGKFFIGKHEDFYKKNSFSCDLLDNNFENLYYWTCELKSFGLEKNNYRITSNHSIPIIFDTGTNFIFLPFEYLKEMEKDLNKIGCKIVEYEENKKENIYDINQIQYRLACSSNNLPQFQFLLGNTLFTLPSSLTFYNYGSLAYSYILFILNNNNNKNPYIFGSPFFMSFHTLFNDEEKKLEFYPLNSRYIINNGNKWYIFKYIIIILALIVLWGTFFYMIYICIKIKREKKEYQSIFSNDINIEMSNKK